MNWAERGASAIRAATLHFLASLAVASLAAALVFGLWFPYPYRELAGGRELFLLVVAVDVVCGPVLTAVLFNSNKSRRELMLDLGLVALVQLAALAYGLHTVAQARPVYLAFEVDRFRVVTVADVHKDTLNPAQGGLHELPWTGPRIIGVRPARDGDEMLASLDLSLRGIEPSARPDWWQAYELSKPQVQAKAQAVANLRRKRVDKTALIDEAVQASGLPEGELAWLPLTSFHSSEWVVFVDKRTADVVSFAFVDGF